MEDLIVMLIGAVMVYIWAHFFTIQFNKAWEKRNGYEKFLTIASIVLLIVILIG